MASLNVRRASRDGDIVDGGSGDGNDCIRAGNGNDTVNAGVSQTVFADADIDTLADSQGTDALWANLVADKGGAIDVLMDNANSESASDIDL